MKVIENSHDGFEKTEATRQECLSGRVVGSMDFHLVPRTACCDLLRIMVHAVDLVHIRPKRVACHTRQLRLAAAVGSRNWHAWYSMLCPMRRPVSGARFRRRGKLPHPGLLGQQTLSIRTDLVVNSSSAMTARDQSGHQNPQVVSEWAHPGAVHRCDVPLSP